MTVSTPSSADNNQRPNAERVASPLVAHRIQAVGAEAEPQLRKVALGAKTLHLLGQLPALGSELLAPFEIPLARGRGIALCPAALSGPLTFVSTLPNIEKHACIAQIVHLHEHCEIEFPEAVVHHVSSDDLEHWQEFDAYHADVRALGYSLAAASAPSVLAFKHAFGVGVAESTRVAHGLFALLKGRFVAAEVPHDQLQAADVDRFLSKLRMALPLFSRPT